MVDVHCHLNFHAFEKDVDQVIKEAFEAGVKAIVNVGTKLDSSEKAVELAKRHENLYAIVGIHPHHADKLDPSSFRSSGQGGWIKDLEKLAKDKKVIGIGECGLDYYSYKSNVIVDSKLQKDVFIKQIELAHRLKLPLQIHNRLAGRDVLDVLAHYKSNLLNPPGMFHCFQGDTDLLKKVLDFGFYIGFDGNITYKGVPPGETTPLSELVKYAPVDRILTETDSPFLTPIPFRGLRNTPKHVIIVGEIIAKLKHLSYPKFRDQMYENTERVFGISLKL